MAKFRPIIKTTRYGALKYIKKILEQNGFYVVQVSKKDTLYLQCLQIFTILSNVKTLIGILHVSLTGTFYTIRMTGFYRRGILQLIPDELEIKCTPQELYTAKNEDYGFYGIYER